MKDLAIWIVGMILSTRPAMPAAIPGAESLDGCQVTCVPVPGGDGDVPPGSGPTGTTFSITFGGTIAGLGMGTDEECLPCPGSYCKQVAAVLFKGYSTGWCFEYDWGGIGSTSPLPRFTRDGYVYTGCATSTWLMWSVVDCNNSSITFSQGMHTLSCVCPGDETQH